MHSPTVSCNASPACAMCNVLVQCIPRLSTRFHSLHTVKSRSHCSLLNNIRLATFSTEISWNLEEFGFRTEKAVNFMNSFKYLKFQLQITSLKIASFEFMFYLLYNKILVLREISKMSSRFVRKEKSLKETGVKSKSEKAAQIYSFLSVWGRLERKRAGRSFSEIDWSANRQLEESATLQWQRQDVEGRPITSKGCAGSANRKARMTSPAVTHQNTNTNTGCFF